MSKDYTLINFMEMKNQTQSVITFKNLIDRQLKHWENNILPDKVTLMLTKIEYINHDVTMTFHYATDEVKLEYYATDEENYLVRMILKLSSLELMINFDKYKSMFESIAKVIGKNFSSLKKEHFNEVWEKYFEVYKKGYMDIFEYTLIKFEVKDYNSTESE